MPSSLPKSPDVACALVALSLAALSLTACAPDQATSTRAGSPRAFAAASHGVALATVEEVEPTSVASIRARLERAAAGLTYTSESDYPFTYFRSTTAVRPPLSAPGFRAALALPPNEPVQELTLDAFFARHIELVDPNDSVAVALVPRYRDLRETIRRSLPGARVFRYGQIQVQCYAVGLDGTGRVVGLRTVAIET